MSAVALIIALLFGWAVVATVVAFGLSVTLTLAARPARSGDVVTDDDIAAWEYELRHPHVITHPIPKEDQS